MIEPCLECLGPSAIALVQHDGVQSGRVRFIREAAHVMGLAGSFESVQRDECSVCLWMWLPVAVGKYASVVSDVEIPRHSWR